MVNFLTSELLWRERVKKIAFISLIILLLILAITSTYLLKLHLENKELKLQMEVVTERIELIEAKTSETDEFKTEKEKLSKELEAKQELTVDNLSIQLLIENLVSLNLEGLYLQEFEINKEDFEVVGVAKEFIYLTQLINQFEAKDFFQSYHLENIDENNGVISFSIRGEIRKELEYD